MARGYKIGSDGNFGLGNKGGWGINPHGDIGIDANENTLGDLADVDLAGQANGNALVFNGTKWVPGAGGVAGGGAGINVKSYGAVADGANASPFDNLTAFTNAIAAAKAARTYLYIPGGTYYVSNAIALEGNLTVWGDGMTQTTILGANGNGVFKAAGTTNGIGSKFITIRDLNIGAKNNVAGGTGIGIDLSYVGQSFFENLVISGFQVGIKMDNTTSNVCYYNTFQHVRIALCRTGIQMTAAVNAHEFIAMRIKDCEVGVDMTSGGATFGPSGNLFNACHIESDLVNSAPNVAPTMTTSSTGGLLPAATYYVRYTWKNTTGESLVSPETSIVTTGATSTINVTTYPPGPNVVTVEIYIGTSPGTGTRQGSTASSSYTQTAALSAGAAAPVSNTITLPSGAIDGYGFKLGQAVQENTFVGCRIELHTKSESLYVTSDTAINNMVFGGSWFANTSSGGFGFKGFVNAPGITASPNMILAVRTPTVIPAVSTIDSVDGTLNYIRFNGRNRTANAATFRWFSYLADNATMQEVMSISGSTDTPTVSLVNGTLTGNSKTRGINVAVGSGATTLAVTFALGPHQDANYAVQVTPNWSTPVWVTNKATTGFTINFPVTSAAQTLDWFAIR